MATRLRPDRPELALVAEVLGAALIAVLGVARERTLPLHARHHRGVARLRQPAAALPHPRHLRGVAHSDVRREHRLLAESLGEDLGRVERRRRRDEVEDRVEERRVPRRARRRVGAVRDPVRGEGEAVPGRGCGGGAPDPDHGETVVVRRGLSVAADLTAPVAVHGEHDGQRPRGGRRRRVIVRVDAALHGAPLDPHHVGHRAARRRARAAASVGCGAESGRRRLLVHSDLALLVLGPRGRRRAPAGGRRRAPGCSGACTCAVVAAQCSHRGCVGAPSLALSAQPARARVELRPTLRIRRGRASATLEREARGVLVAALQRALARSHRSRGQGKRGRCCNHGCWGDGGKRGRCCSHGCWGDGGRRGWCCGRPRVAAHAGGGAAALAPALRCVVVLALKPAAAAASPVGQPIPGSGAHAGRWRRRRRRRRRERVPA
eukprot:gene1388-biopygen12042